MKRIRNMFYIIILICISVFSVRIEFQNDTFFSIAVGRQITKTGIDMIEHLTWHTNLMYTYSHWMLDLYNYFIFNFIGFKGIYISVALVVIMIAMTLYSILIKQLKLNRFISLLIVFSVICMDSPFFVARAQVLSYLLFLCEILLIEKVLETNGLKYKIGLLIIPVLIANFHAALFPMYFILYLPYLVEILFGFLTKKANNNEIIEKNKYSKVYYENEKYAKSLIIVFVISIFTGFITPIGSTPYTYMIKTMNDGYSSNSIKELQATSLIDLPYLQIYLLIFVVMLIYKKSRIKISDLLMFIGLFILALTNIRGIAYFILLGTIPLVKLVKNYSIKLDFLSEKNIFYIKVLLYAIMGALCFCFILININLKFVNERNFPIGACEYILENVDYRDMKIYNGFNYGSYIEFKEIPSFMDSRSEMYTKAYNDTEIFKDYLEVKSGKITYDELTDKYGLTHFLIDKDSLIDNYMRNDDGYKELYSDDYFVLYEVVRVEAL